MKEDSKDFSAAFLIIGNEILSGRTTEKNLPVLAGLLGARGWRLAEARVVADVTADIAVALNDLRHRYARVFTSGGIGPTHDDITTDSVAQALALEVIEHPEAVALLGSFYQQRGLEFTPARQRMARTPHGAAVIKSAFPGAPAYRIENVIVCAGVPSIFAQMASAAVQQLPAGASVHTLTLRVWAGESVFSDALTEIAAAHAGVQIGSYPREENNRYVCQIVFNAIDQQANAAARDDFCRYLQRENLPYEELL